MSANIEQAFERQSPGGFAAALDAELASRIHSLGEQPHADSECFASSRPCFVEAGVWGALGVAIWIATLAYLS